MAIFPVLNIATGVNSITKGDLTLLAAFPNPTANEIIINFGLNHNLNVGNHSSKINVSDLNAGVYMYSVKSENAKMFSKFTVTKY